MIDDRPQVSCAFNAAARHTPKSTTTDEPRLAPDLTLDLEKYSQMLEGMDLTPKQERELLQALWETMCRFVELGWGLTPGLLTEGDDTCEQSTDNPALTNQFLLDLNQLTNTDDEPA